MKSHIPDELEHGDTIFGGAGNDLVFAGDGKDVIFADAGSDTIEGGQHGDTYNVSLRGGKANSLTTIIDLPNTPSGEGPL